MSWTALMLVGAVLAQTSPARPELRDAPPASPQSFGAGSGASGATGGFRNPTGGYGGLNGNAPASAQPPLPASDWRLPAAGAEASPAGSDPSQPIGQPPVSGSGTSGAAPNSNLWERFNYVIDEATGGKTPAEGAAPNPAPSYGTQQPVGTEPPPYGTGVTAPSTASRSETQFPVAAGLTAEEMLAQAMMLPASTVIVGRSVTLVDVIGQVTDRSKRVEIAHAYWHLVRKLGEYRSCWEESQQIQAIRLKRIDSSLLAPAQDAADRELTAAELALREAQFYLAETAGLDPSGELPLPGNRPHLGTYNTHYEQISADRVLPTRTRLIHRILPLEYQVIDVRGEAVHAAQDTLQAVDRSYWAGQANAADVLAALHGITTQRRAWIAAVARYNDSIADYALAIAGPETTGRGLVEILIKLSQAEPADGSPEEAGEVNKIPGEPTLAPPREQVAEASESRAVPPVPVDPAERMELTAEPASAESPVAADGVVGFDPLVKPAVAEAPEMDPYGQAEPALNEPEVAERQTAQKEGVSGEPAAANEMSETGSAAQGVENADEQQVVATGDADSSETVAEDGVSQPGAAEREMPALDTRDLIVRTRPLVPVEESDTTPKIQRVFKVPSDSLLRQHGDLVGLRPEVQAKRLTAAFHRGADAARSEVGGVDLEACLDGVIGRQRLAVIEAYWEASLRVAEYEVYRRHAEVLDDLVKSVTLGAAGTADARSRLKTAQLDAKANLLGAESRRLAAQYELTARCGRSLDEPWIMPKTLPHAGDYQLHLESQAPQLVESWNVKRLAAIIPALGRSLKERAVAVVRADALRTEALNAYQDQRLPFSHVLSVVDGQTEESLEFLNVLTAYNQSYADYVTAVVPETLPEKQLVATLVVR